MQRASKQESGPLLPRASPQARRPAPNPAHASPANAAAAAALHGVVSTWGCGCGRSLPDGAGTGANLIVSWASPLGPCGPAGAPLRVPTCPALRVTVSPPPAYPQAPMPSAPIPVRVPACAAGRRAAGARAIGWPAGASAEAVLRRGPGRSSELRTKGHAGEVEEGRRRCIPHVPPACKHACKHARCKRWRLGGTRPHAAPCRRRVRPRAVTPLGQTLPQEPAHSSCHHCSWDQQTMHPAHSMPLAPQRERGPRAQHEQPTNRNAHASRAESTPLLVLPPTAR